MAQRATYPRSPANPCHLVLDHTCEAPANGHRSTRYRCFACGQPVCGPCSRMVARYYGFGRRRVCCECITTHGDHVTLDPKEDPCV